MEKSANSGNKNKNSYKFGKFHQTFECIKLGGNYIYIYIYISPNEQQPWLECQVLISFNLF